MPQGLRWITKFNTTAIKKSEIKADKNIGQFDLEYYSQQSHNNKIPPSHNQNKNQGESC